MTTSEKKRYEKKYRVIDSWIRRRGLPERSERNPDTGLPLTAYWLLKEGSKKSIKAWILDGLRSTDGAERDHYVDLLEQLEEGLTELDYRRV